MSFRLHFFTEEPTEVLAWLCIVPINIQILQKEIGSHNLEKPSIPVLAFNLKDPAGEKLKVQITPTEEAKGYGLNLLAFIEGTRVEGNEVDPTPEAYRKATRELSSVGLWPNNSQIRNLRKKLRSYQGGLSTYSPANKKKASWYKIEDSSAENFSELMKKLVDQHLSYFKQGTFELPNEELQKGKLLKEPNEKEEEVEAIERTRSSLSLSSLDETPTDSSPEPKGKENENEKLLEEPGAYFIFAHHMELPPIPLYVGKASDIKRRLTNEHDFGKNFTKFKTALSKARKCEDLKLDLYLTVVYTKNDLGLAPYLEGLFLHLFDFAFNRQDNEGYRFEGEEFLNFIETMMTESAIPNAASLEDQSTKLDEVRKTLIIFPFYLNLIKSFHFSLKGPSRKLLETLRNCRSCQKA